MPIKTTQVHHVTLTVSDLERSKAFYTDVLGFQFAAAISPTRYAYSNGQMLLVTTLPPNPENTPPNDKFSEDRIGLDHVSLGVADRAALDEAMRVFDDCGVPHGEIKDLGEAFGICVLAFRDPDNIQLELTAPRG